MDLTNTFNQSYGILGYLVVFFAGPTDEDSTSQLTMHDFHQILSDQ